MNNQLENSKLNDSIMSPDKFDHYMHVANQMAKSTMVPKAYQNKPMDILICMEMGYQLGLPMMQALQNIAVINGTPCLWGDGLLAVVQGHPEYEWIKEEPIIKRDIIFGYSCKLKRKNHEPHTYIFTLDDAKKAGLLGKQGPWTQYPNRMLQMRARGFALRNVFADAIEGIKTAEEVLDYTEKEPELIEIKSNVYNETNTNQLKRLINDKIERSREHENTEIDQLSTYDITNYNLQDSVINHSEETTENANVSKMDQSRKEKINNLKSNDSGKRASEEQINIIENTSFLIDFPIERMRKALNHYGVSTLQELTEKQANHFIDILNKESKSD